MNRWWWLLLAVAGCHRAAPPAATPPPPPPVSFPAPTPEQQVQLAGLEEILRGPFHLQNLQWVGQLGPVAIPELARLATNSTLSVGARDTVLLGLGNALAPLHLVESPDSRNDVVVPVLLAALADPDKRIRRSAAFAARFIRDDRLGPVLLARLADVDIAQEQAVLALGSNGDAATVLPVMQQFFAVEDGQFRYSCLHALSLLALRQNLDVAVAIQAGDFPEAHRDNARSVADRFRTWQELRALLAAGDFTGLQARTGRDLASASAAWRDYLLKDFWLQPPAR